jgi:hypothetical protein
MEKSVDTNTKLPAADAELALELETWDWARAAGVSADELRQALKAELAAPELRKAA